MNKLKILLLFTLIVCSSAIHGQERENFESFLSQFGSNQNFQLERIKFPLTFITWENPEEIGGEIATHKLTKEEWKHDYFYMNQSYRPQIYDNFEGELRDSDERLFQWIGIETGANVKYYFKRIDGKWFLVKKENLGD